MHEHGHALLTPICDIACSAKSRYLYGIEFNSLSLSYTVLLLLLLALWLSFFCCRMQLSSQMHENNHPYEYLLLQTKPPK